MTITQEDVRHVARLSRLAFSDEEIQRFTSDLTRIVDLVQQLDTLDLSQIDLDIHPEYDAMFRDDIEKQLYPKTVLLKNAPQEEEGFFRVPRILEEASE